MAAALMTLLHASVLPETELSDEAKPGEAKLGAASQLSLAEPGTISKQTPPCTTLPSALRQLVGVAEQLANVDKMVQSAQVEAPAKADTEAHKWHEVSLRALLWSRAALQEQQQRILCDIKANFIANAQAEPTAAAVQAKPPVAPPRGRVTGELPPWRRAAAARPPAVEPIPEVGPPPNLEPEKPVHPEVGSLRADLERLRKCDPALCIIVRKIKKLGLESREQMERHFGQFGPLSEVLVAHSFEKPSPKRRHGRVRPAALGFLVMGAPEAAEAVIAAGVNQLVAGVEVSVQMFQPFMDLASITKDCD